MLEPYLNPMKNTTLYFTAFAVWLFTIAGCKKEDLTVNGIDLLNIPKIKTHSYYTGNDKQTDTYTYDSRGRCSVRTTTDSTGAFKYSSTYTYGSNTITITTTANPQPYTITLNEQGFMSDYTYTPDGYLLCQGPLTYTWNDANISSVSYFGMPAELCTALTDKANTIGNANMGIAHLGKDAKNLMGSKGNYTYQYTFDAQGRVIARPDTGEEFTYY